jgi:hypothetical protein
MPFHGGGFCYSGGRASLRLQRCDQRGGIGAEIP